MLYADACTIQLRIAPEFQEQSKLFVLLKSYDLLYQRQNADVQFLHTPPRCVQNSFCKSKVFG